MADFYIKQGDTRPTLTRQLLDEDGEPVDVTGATVRFTLEDPSGAVVVTEQLCTVLDGPTGEVAYEWQPGDTDRDGAHLGEFEVTYADGGVQTFPNPKQLTIEIGRQLA